MNAPGLAALPSLAASAFDLCAGEYDETFTNSRTGRAQRNQVWRRLERVFPAGSRILELNCGTGEDARFLATRGCRLLACDASAKMIEVARRRTQQAKYGDRIEFLELANEDVGRLAAKRRFEGAMSNFSGMNCVAELGPVARGLSALLGPGARLMLCVWSRICAAETASYLLRGEPRKAFRRFPGRGTARLNGTSFSVFYPSVREIRRAFLPWFELKAKRAVGLFVPPSYLEDWARKHQRWLATFENLDRYAAAWPVLRGLGDHVLLEFVRCPR